MKHIFFLSLLVLAFGSARAQSRISAEDQATSALVATAPTGSAPAARVVYADRSKPMNNIEMKVADGWAAFYNMEGLQGLHLYVTNGNGQVEIDRRISPRSNAVEIDKLRSGLYFVTLINEGTDERRTFTLNR